MKLRLWPVTMTKVPEKVYDRDPVRLLELRMGDDWNLAPLMPYFCPGLKTCVNRRTSLMKYRPGYGMYFMKVLTRLWAACLVRSKEPLRF